LRRESEGKLVTRSAAVREVYYTYMGKANWQSNFSRRQLRPDKKPVSPTSFDSRQDVQNLLVAAIQTPFGFNSTAAEVIEGVDLWGKRAIVTGGASGTGIETA